MCKSHNRRIMAVSPWIWVNSWQTWIISVQTQSSRSGIVQRLIRAISLRPGVGSPFSFFCLIKIYEVLMLSFSPPHLRELFLLYASMNQEGNEELISIIPVSYYVCWYHEANCKKESIGRGPQAVLERPRAWFPLLCPYLTVSAAYYTNSSSREWQKRGFNRKIGVSVRE